MTLSKVVCQRQRLVAISARPSPTCFLEAPRRNLRDTNISLSLQRGSGPKLLLALQTGAVPLFPQPPPLQVAGALQPVHPGSQEDDDAARHQLGGHPALRGETARS